MFTARRFRTSRMGIFLILFMFTLAVACSQPISSLGRAKTLPSQTGIDGLGLGTNLTGIADWSTQLPFIDGFKSSRSWFTRCAPEEACSAEWSTDEADKLDLDSHGWVKSLPAPTDPPRYSRVSTLLYREIGRYPGGQYVVLYDGEGAIEYEFDAKKDVGASRPGRDLIDVTPSDSGILLTVSATDPAKTGNYIRNIRVIPTQFEQTYESEIFNPVFLERIKQFGTLRFMDWMATNNSQQSKWQNRPQIEDKSYAEKGVPLELMIELANRLRANPWFNMPHQATDEYMINFAQLVKTKLDPKLTAYVELSNEVWNWMFDQAQYALKQGKARWGEDKGDAYMQWYGMRTAQMSDIWKRAFGNQHSRVRTIISTQTAWKGLETSALDCPLWVAEGNQPCYQHGLDAYAVTGYFSGGLGDDQERATVEAWLNDPDGGVKRALAQIEQGGNLKTSDSLADTKQGFIYHQQVAQQKQLKLVVYEGGQSLANPNSEKLTEFFIKLNRRPEMYKFYQQLLNDWKETGGTLFMNFADIGEPSKWGSWGVLEHVDQESSPRYNALLNFIAQNQLR
ncbi:MAG: hypothetical protein KME07_10720 [Pegethrix bostrychoides GSE-TBD4-15B]|uniref:Cellulose-binding protein n=1 Tax=Pegethrix bostrychoides GSE-TBD4-15B TaxID=2839662 RepID=A0A951PB49_9CYAN|nr:hypothetical protein [Pegethrix bostrychoides GSE-TBD4-15B]